MITVICVLDYIWTALMVKLQVYVSVPCVRVLLLQHVYAPEISPSSNSDITFVTLFVPAKHNKPNLTHTMEQDNKVI